MVDSRKLSLPPLCVLRDHSVTACCACWPGLP